MQHRAKQQGQQCVQHRYPSAGRPVAVVCGLLVLLALAAPAVNAQERAPSFRAATGLLSIPCVRVGAKRYRVELSLVSSSPMEFVLGPVAVAAGVECNSAVFADGVLELSRVETAQAAYSVLLDHLVQAPQPYTFRVRSVAVAPFALDGHGAVTFSVPPEGPPDSGEVALEEAFPRLPSRGAGATPSDGGLFLSWVPASDYNIVVEKPGRILIFENDAETDAASVFLDIRARVAAGAFDERGLLGCAFDPLYDSNRYFYCYYTRSGDSAGVLSRFRTSAVDPLRAEADSEVVLIVIPQPENNHNGGMLAFGPVDNHLYLSLGDGGGANDNHGETGNAQNRGNLLGSIIRIDPETDADGGYSIPRDNPFGTHKCADGVADSGQVCGEIFHYGLRNPWRFSFDAFTGDGWIGDVGQNAREEIDLWLHGQKGLNFGWPCREALIAGPKPDVASCDEPAEVTDPVSSFATGASESVIGGYVYRGSEVPPLQGLYLYARLGDREVYTIDGQGELSLLLSTGSQSVYSFGEDIHGELYALFADGGIARFGFEPDGSGEPIPELLSETGVFEDVGNLVPDPALIPYVVNSPLFSDYSDKRRWFGLPAGGNIDFSADGGWRFPLGSIAVKQFDYQGRRIETRLLVRGEDQWLGYTYRWNEAQTEATLVGPNGATLTLPDGRLYDLPSRADCQSCHGRGQGGASEQLLGLRTAQLNTSHLYPNGVLDNQLRSFERAELFDVDILPPQNYARLPDYRDPGAGTLEQRARSYLHSNCAGCHRSGGMPAASINLEYGASLARTGLVSTQPVGESVNGAELLLDPGSRENSIVWQRMRLTVPDPRAMPPLTHRQVDAEGVELIGSWIDQLGQ